MSRMIVVFLLALFTSACSVGKVLPLDPKTGRLPAQAQAVVVTSKAVDLDSRKALVLISNDEFMNAQLAKFAYFDQIMKYEDLEKAIIQANLTEKVPSISEKIGVNNAAKFYKPFLWLRAESRKGDGHEQYARFILTDAVTMEDLFITETELDYAWKGVNDQYNWYPMFNALIDYIQANSKTFQPHAAAQVTQ